MRVIAVEGPDAPAIPLILDSPHSGDAYPDEFDTHVPRHRVRRAEDFKVDALFGDVPTLGVPLLKALFPRIVVDVNRAKTDISPDSVDGVLPFTAKPSAKARLGKGVIWMDAPPPPDCTPLYEAPLSPQSVTNRLARYWTPYRDALTERIGAIRDAHGKAYYIDCHSMQTVSSQMHEEGAGIPRPQIVLSDGDGTTASPDFVTACAKALSNEGLEVSINDPYKGADLIRSHGRPAENVHAVQVEIRRDLYMDEDALTLTDGFAVLKDKLTRAVKAITASL